jgi:type IV fimbrial biogenesis protein FimT
MQSMRGTSLTELIAVLAVGLVVAGLALPSMAQLHQRHRTTSAMNQLIGAVQFARHSAVTHRSVVTLCPSGDGVDCAGRDEWHLGAIVFLDGDANGRRDAGDLLLRVFPALPAGARVYWRSFRNRSYLQMMPNGFTHWQNGNFLYCPQGALLDPTLARSIIVNAQGRVRVAHDQSGDGIAQDAQGRPLACPAG